MSDKISILKYMTGYPNMYRNHFCTDEGCADYELLEQMREEGLVIKHPKKEWLPDYTYVATEKGE